MAWFQGLVPSFLLPTFTWPHRIIGAAPLAKDVPHIPQPMHKYLRKLWGFVHLYLRTFSRHYCRWCGIEYSNQIIELPFGLVLKWSDGTRIEEVIATKVARAAGLPVPIILTYGDHPDYPHAPMSILMIRLPGRELDTVYEELSEMDQEAAFTQVKLCLDTIRGWSQPRSKTSIHSIMGTGIRSVRIPDHLAPPCENEAQFNKHLLSTASGHSFPSHEEYEEKLRYVEKSLSTPHRILYSHGDLKHHNILFHEGNISLIDWESAGWYPEYWEYTTALQFCPADFWWFDFVKKLGGAQYEKEQEMTRALTALTVDSWVW